MTNLEDARARLAAAKAGDDPEELRDASQALADARMAERIAAEAAGERTGIVAVANDDLTTEEN